MLIRHDKGDESSTRALTDWLEVHLSRAIEKMTLWKTNFATKKKYILLSKRLQDLYLQTS